MEDEEKEKNISCYSTISVADSTGALPYRSDSYLKRITIEKAKNFLDQHKFELIKDKSCDLNSILLKISKEKSQLEEPILCLRCKISQYIFNSCEKLFFTIIQNNNNCDLELSDFLQECLNDDGDIWKYKYTKKELKTKNISEKENPKEKINWDLISNLSREKRDFHPFSLEVINTYNPSKGKLSNWTNFLVKANKHLKILFKKNFLIPHSKLSYINIPRNIETIIKAWEQYGDGNYTTSEIIVIYKSFQLQYNKERESKLPKQKIKWDTTKRFDFFISLVNPKIKKEDQRTIEYENIKALDSIYIALRYYLGHIKPYYRKEEKPHASSLEPSKDLEEWPDKSSLEPSKDLEERDSFEKMKSILRENCRKYIHNKFIKDKQLWEENPIIKRAWELYGEGKSQREIKEILKKRNAWVGNIIKEKIMVEDISRKALKKALDDNLLEPTKKDIVDERRLLLEELLNGKKQVKTNISILKEIVYEYFKK